ncbi:MAG: hypothetical protein IPL09_03845 [Bacteroidetes bacterium]|nr:hypothetical protein [Bacteroidota bacterium]
MPRFQPLKINTCHSDLACQHRLIYKQHAATQVLSVPINAVTTREDEDSTGTASLENNNTETPVKGYVFVVNNQQKAMLTGSENRYSRQ